MTKFALKQAVNTINGNLAVYMVIVLRNEKSTFFVTKNVLFVFKP